MGHTYVRDGRTNLRHQPAPGAERIIWNSYSAAKYHALITDNERGDFGQCIVAANLSVDDFELTEQRDAGGPKEGYFPTGTVTVTYKPTGIKRDYSSGHLLTWTAG